MTSETTDPAARAAVEIAMMRSIYDGPSDFEAAVEDFTAIIRRATSERERRLVGFARVTVDRLRNAPWPTHDPAWEMIQAGLTDTLRAYPDNRDRSHGHPAH